MFLYHGSPVFIKLCWQKSMPSLIGLYIPLAKYHSNSYSSSCIISLINPTINQQTVVLKKSCLVVIRPILVEFSNANQISIHIFLFGFFTYCKCAFFLIVKLSLGAVQTHGLQKPVLSSKNFHGCLENLIYNDLNLIELAKKNNHQVSVMVSAYILASVEHCHYLLLITGTPKIFSDSKYIQLFISWKKTLSNILEITVLVWELLTHQCFVISQTPTLDLWWLWCCWINSANRYSLQTR